MKKYAALILLLCLVLTGCNSGKTQETSVPSTAETAAPVQTTDTVTYAVPGEDEMPGNASDADWGLTLTAEKVNAMGATIRYSQSGGNPTGELHTGSFFSLEVFDGEWKEAQTLTHDHEIAWNSVAYMIPMGAETEMAEDWSYLYGPLQPGWYRIGKEIMDFRGTGDYDKTIFYAYFEITD